MFRLLAALWNISPIKTGDACGGCRKIVNPFAHVSVLGRPYHFGQCALNAMGFI